MPKTINGLNARKNIRIPARMAKEIDKTAAEQPELYYNRQQFIESAIREKIERMRPVGARVLTLGLP
jgi:metal-responsive CopG/Arc/MetJ family transcriptional regulator